MIKKLIKTENKEELEVSVSVRKSAFSVIVRGEKGCFKYRFSTKTAEKAMVLGVDKYVKYFEVIEDPTLSGDLERKFYL